MARQARLIVPGHAHLVLQRGNLRATLFDGPDTAQGYLQNLSTLARERAVRVHAFGLFAHEVRLLVTPETAAGLSALMKALAMRHAHALNRADGAAGSPWQGRYGCAVVDPAAHALDATLFVEGAGEPAEDVIAASAPHHAGTTTIPWLAVHASYWALGNTPFEREAVYRERQFRGVSPALAQIMRMRAVSGWAIGSPAFLADVGRIVDRPATPRLRGRPKKSVPI